jgi:hypothetical protein
MASNKRNEAELGWTNLKMALGDASLLSETAEWLRHDRTAQTQMVRMMADPQFRAHAKDVAEKLKIDGELPNLFHLDYYARFPMRPGSIERLARASQAAAAFHVPVAPTSSHTVGLARSSSARMDEQAREQLKADARLAFPIGFFDPLKFSEEETIGESNAANIGFLRHAELKHGRVCMAAFIGYCFAENGVHFPFPIYPGETPDRYQDMSALAVWDNIPELARYQIIAAVGLLEWWGENSEAIERQGGKHYMRGGKAGFYPTFENKGLNLYDPFGLSKRMTEQQKRVGTAKEINNGRLAMIGFVSLVTEANIPGSVPFLEGLIKHYDPSVTGARYILESNPFQVPS